MRINNTRNQKLFNSNCCEIQKQIPAFGSVQIGFSPFTKNKQSALYIQVLNDIDPSFIIDKFTSQGATIGKANEATELSRMPLHVGNRITDKHLAVDMANADELRLKLKELRKLPTISWNVLEPILGDIDSVIKNGVIIPKKGSLILTEPRNKSIFA